MTLLAIRTFAQIFLSVWVISVVMVDRLHGLAAENVARAIIAEMRPFFWVVAIADICEAAATPGPLSMLDTILKTGSWLIGWYIARHIDDDRWKRRRRKVKEKIVASLSGKLVVQPA